MARQAVYQPGTVEPGWRAGGRSRGRATAERPRTPGDQIPPLPSVTLTFSGLAVPQLAGQQPGSQNAGTAG
jgi:hypothetical protein